MPQQSSFSAFGLGFLRTHLSQIILMALSWNSMHWLVEYHNKKFYSDYHWYCSVLEDVTAVDFFTFEFFMFYRLFWATYYWVFSQCVFLVKHFKRGDRGRQRLAALSGVPSHFLRVSYFLSPSFSFIYLLQLEFV